MLSLILAAALQSAFAPNGVVPLFDGMTTATTTAEAGAKYVDGGASGKVRHSAGKTDLDGYQITRDCKVKVEIFHPHGTVEKVLVWWSMHPSCSRDVGASLRSKYGIASDVGYGAPYILGTDNYYTSVWGNEGARIDFGEDRSWGGGYVQYVASPTRITNKL